MRAVTTGLVFAALALVPVNAGAAPAFQNFPFGSHKAELGGIVAGPDGNLWFTDTTDHALVRMSPTGTFRSFPLSVTVDSKRVDFSPWQLTVGADHRLYVGGCEAVHCSYIIVASVSGTYSPLLVDPYAPGIGGLTLGPDGNVWFAGGGGYASVTPAGQITRYAFGQYISATGDIASSSGAIWIGQQNSYSYPYERLAVDEIDPASGAPVRSIPFCMEGSSGYFIGMAAAASSVYAGCAGSPGFPVIRIEQSGVQTAFSTVIGPAIRVGSSAVYTETKDGRMWFASPPDYLSYLDPTNGGTGAIPSPFAVTGGAITIGPDGNIWFVNSGDHPSITRYVLSENRDIVSSRTVRRSVLQTAGANAPYWVTFNSQTGKDRIGGIVAGPDGNVWYTDAQKNHVLRMAMDGTATTFALTFKSLPFVPGEITVGGDGKFYMGGCFGKGIECLDPAIGVMTTKGSFSALVAESHDGVGLSNGLALGPDGNVWAAEKVHIAKITPAGQITEYSYPTGMKQDGTGVVTAGPDGAVWFTLGPANIGRIEPQTGAMTVYSVTCASGIAFVQGALFDGCATSSGSRNSGPSTLQRLSGAGVASLVQNPFFSTGRPIAGPGRQVWLLSGYQRGSFGAADLEEYMLPGKTFFAFPLPPSQFLAPFPTIAEGPDGNVWVTEPGTIDIFVLNVLSVRPSQLILSGVGASGSLLAAYRGPGTLSATSSDQNVVTVVRGSHKNTFLVTSAGVGVATVTIEDGIGNEFAVPVTVIPS